MNPMNSNMRFAGVYKNKPEYGNTLRYFYEGQERWATNDADHADLSTVADAMKRESITYPHDSETLREISREHFDKLDKLYAELEKRVKEALPPLPSVTKKP